MQRRGVVCGTVFPPLNSQILDMSESGVSFLIQSFLTIQVLDCTRSRWLSSLRLVSFWTCVAVEISRRLSWLESVKIQEHLEVLSWAEYLFRVVVVAGEQEASECSDTLRGNFTADEVLLPALAIAGSRCAMK